MSSTSQKEQSAIVVVHVLEARNLPPMDSNGLADPYCFLCVSKAKLKGGGKRSRATSPTAAPSDALAMAPTAAVPQSAPLPHSPNRLHVQPVSNGCNAAPLPPENTQRSGSDGSQHKPKKEKERKGPFGWIRKRAGSRSSSKALKLKLAEKERAAAAGQLTAPTTPTATPSHSPNVHAKQAADRASLSPDMSRRLRSTFNSDQLVAEDATSCRLQDSLMDLRSSRELCASSEQLNSLSHTSSNTPLMSPRPSMREASPSVGAASQLERFNRTERATIIKRATIIQRYWLQQLSQLHLQHQREDKERQAQLSSRTHKKRRPSVGEAAIAATAALAATAVVQETVSEAVEAVAKGGLPGPDGSPVFRTRIIYKTLHPVWKETFYLYAAAPPPLSSSRNRARI